MGVGINVQKFDFSAFLYCVQASFAVNVKVDIGCYCELPSSPTQFYSDVLHNHALSNATKFRSSVTDLTVAATEQPKAAPATVPFADIGIEGIRHLPPAEMAVENGYEWLQEQVVMAALQMGS